MKAAVLTGDNDTIVDLPPVPDSERRQLEELVRDVLENGPPSERAQRPPSDGGPSLRLYPIAQEVNISSSYFQMRCVRPPTSQPDNLKT